MGNKSAQHAPLHIEQAFCYANALKYPVYVGASLTNIVKRSNVDQVIVMPHNDETSLLIP